MNYNLNNVNNENYDHLVGLVAILLVNQSDLSIQII